MKLSVIIPCYNCQNTIKKLLQNLLNQKVSFDYELILIDDSSKDGTYDILKKFQNKNIIIKHNIKNKGNGYSKNLGISLAKGELILFLDDACSIYDHYFLQKYVDCYNDQEISGVCGFYQTENADIDYNYIRDLRREFIYNKKKGNTFKITEQNWTPFSIVVGGMRRKILKDTKFPTDFGQFSSEDTLLQLMLEKKGKVLYFDGNIQCFHTHNLSLKDIILKLRIEIIGAYFLYKKIKSLDLPYHPQKFYLDSIFIPIIIISISLINKYIFFLLLISFFGYRYYIPGLNCSTSKKLGFITYVFFFDFFKHIILLRNLDFKLILFLIKKEFFSYLSFIKINGINKKH